MMFFSLGGSRLLLMEILEDESIVLSYRVSSGMRVILVVVVVVVIPVVLVAFVK